MIDDHVALLTIGQYPDIFTCLEGGNYKLPVNATILCLDAVNEFRKEKKGQAAFPV